MNATSRGFELGIYLVIGVWCLGFGVSGPACLRNPTALFPVSFAKPKVHQIVILHDILFGFQTLFARPFRLCLAARLNEIFKPDDFSADKTLLQIGVNGAGS